MPISEVRKAWIEKKKKEDPEYFKNQSQRAYISLKKKVIEAYGGKCVCCGEDDFRFLTIDHVYDDGARHREKIGDAGKRTYLWLKRNNYPQDRFQLLCANCNTAKRWGECPHQQP